MSAYSGIDTDLNGLARLRTQAQQRPQAALEEVAGQFEALFTRMMLKTMRESSMNSDLMSSSQSSQYLEMFDGQIAQEMSRGRGLGLKELLIRQLGQLDGAAPLERPVQAQRLEPGSKEDFIAGLRPFARQVEQELGISHRAVLAQAALESGWGRHTMRKPDGSDSFNFFGIKADASWNGERVAKRTLEFRDGIGTRETANFRSYDSMGEAVKDYAEFIRSNPRYEQAIERGADPHAYAQELQRAGYATDPKYAQKIVAILDSDVLRDEGQAGVL
ncbi:MAG: flagellar assembly peptidoglycan hydrolase FlgJ [Gammaproteobacteria bacterium]|nr:flagellar assembly peptidoglycan hydrolase FlgJ [Gammaproteobacteria bacterium]NNM19950.1 flagellar assembly peptidoglycan hydrolase FlgJ [Gammaproteobacteria bacterium]